MPHCARHDGPPADEAGQSLVVVALMMVVLVAFLAMVVDVGNMYAERRLMQNAADAGAIAGARAMALNQNPMPAVTQYAEVLNGAGASQTTVITPTVIVSVNKTCPTYFASIIGVPSFDVRAVAEARYSAPSSFSGGNLLPIAVHKDAIRHRPEKTLIWDSDTVLDGPKDPDDYPIGWEQAKDNLIAGAQRGWLDLNNDGSMSDAELKAWVQYGYRESVIREGDWISGDPGSRSAALQSVYGYRQNKVIIVPLYDEVNYVSGNQADYHIVGFAAFTVIDVQWKSSFKYVLGYFEQFVATEDQQGGGSYDAGLRVVELQR